MSVFPNQSFPNLRSPLVLPTNFIEMSIIGFSVRSAVFTMEFWLFWKFLPMNTADSIVTDINILQIIECSSPYPATLEILFCLWRTWSFTRFTNDVDSTDNSNPVSSLPMMKILRSCHFLRIDVIKSPWSMSASKAGNNTLVTWPRDVTVPQSRDEFTKFPNATCGTSMMLSQTKCRALQIFSEIDLLPCTLKLIVEPIGASTASPVALSALKPKLKSCPLLE